MNTKVLRMRLAAHRNPSALERECHTGHYIKPQTQNLIAAMGKFKLLNGVRLKPTSGLEPLTCRLRHGVRS